MQRRNFIRHASFASAGFFIKKYPLRSPNAFPIVRIAEAERKFKSPAIERAIAAIKKNVGNKEMAWLFENCFPNTLDTTVDFEIINGKPDTYVITGDIDAMWLRDSSAQVWPYLPFANEDKDLKLLIEGVIRRQTKCILKDPYANAFYKDENKISEWKTTDDTDMKPGIHERKWEIDSLCYPVRLAHGYWKETGDTSVFDRAWMEAMELVVKTFKEQQRKNGEGPYSFQRKTDWATDGVPMGGYGYPTKKVGLIHSMFRPSDDATIFPFLIPGNLFAAYSLLQLADIAKAMGQLKFSEECSALMNELMVALKAHGIAHHPKFGDVFAYEADGFGNHTFMDDANVPSLLSLPYLEMQPHGSHLSVLNKQQPGYAVYQNTRRLVLSGSNPFFFKGEAGEGIGGPHAGLNMIWPLSIIMRGLTSNDDKEIKFCLDMLQKNHAGTGFMHESFNKDDAFKFTRKWFAWANTLFGELVWDTYKKKKYLLD
ncbi:MAG: glycoside hydrolase family 125 protein [Bacteroidetes bacterium]|nr:glycoside hydrolase family 125 protein [Bacteroidota bacterium]MBS1975430.1 glycoside hydrolase family 125 protein [Bacteroidota bacterium]